MTPGFDLTIGREDWGTPPEAFAFASDRWGPFDLDAAAFPWNAKVARFFSLWQQSPRSGGAVLSKPYIEDGLRERWHGRVWLNPPYGRLIRRWLDKARREVSRGHCERVVFLLPARTDTAWFHECCLDALAKVFFVRGRLWFEGATAPAPFPSVFVVIELPEGDRVA